MFFRQNVAEVSFLTLLIFSIIIVFQLRTNRFLKKETVQKEKALQEKKHALKKLQQIAHYDSLTGLANRHLSLIILEQMIHRSVRHEETLVVCFVDLDRFKSINDTYGHDMGDEVLRRVAKILKDALRKVDIIGRLGGDEFLLVAEEVSDIEKFQERLEEVIKTIQELDTDMELDLSFGASIGAVYGIPKNYTSTELIKLSDELMYQAKRAGKGLVILKPIPENFLPQKTLFGGTNY